MKIEKIVKIENLKEEYEEALEMALEAQAEGEHRESASWMQEAANILREIEEAD